MKVFLNPGHCPGRDPGACGHGLIEAEVALKIARRVEKYLQAVGIATKLFQYDGLYEIADDANNWGADLFISIHCNAAASSSANGTETYCWNAGEGRKLAECIHKQIVSSIHITDRKVKSANFTVLARTNMPAVLVETAFITNPRDARLLVEQEDEFARAIARGVTDYENIAAPMPDFIDPPTTRGKLSEHFDASEFVCHHCGKGADKISRRLIILLEELRQRIGKPLHINSGYRCPEHNRNIGGAQGSQHMYGNAADVATPTGMNFETFKWYVNQLPFDGVGYYPPIDGGDYETGGEEEGDSFVHLDTRNGGVGARICWEG